MNLVMKFVFNILRGPTALRIFALIMFLVAGATSLAICYVLKNIISTYVS